MTTDNKSKWSCDWNVEIRSLALWLQGEEFDIPFFEQRMDELKQTRFLRIPSPDESALISAQERAKAFARHTPGSIVKTEYGKLSLGDTGYTVKLHVPKQVSTKCFNEVYANDAFPFRDYLLANHRQLLEKISATYGYSSYDGRSHLSAYLCSWGMSSDKDLPWNFKESPPHGIRLIKFSDFGMEDFSHSYQILGFAFAMFEIFKEKSDSSHETTHLSLRTDGYNVDLHCYCEEIPLPPPKLSKW